MNVQEAKSKLKKLAKGRYHTVQYELTEYNSGRLVESYRLSVEVEGGGDVAAEGASFEDCLDMVEQGLQRFEELEIEGGALTIGRRK
jgi:hypothetical protein